MIVDNGADEDAFGSDPMRRKLEITIGGCVLVAVALCVGDVLEAQVLSLIHI